MRKTKISSGLLRPGGGVVSSDGSINPTRLRITPGHTLKALLSQLDRVGHRGLVEPFASCRYPILPCTGKEGGGGKDVGWLWCFFLFGRASANLPASRRLHTATTRAIAEPNVCRLLSVRCIPGTHFHSWGPTVPPPPPTATTTTTTTTRSRRPFFHFICIHVASFQLSPATPPNDLLYFCFCQKFFERQPVRKNDRFHTQKNSGVSHWIRQKSL